jgi:hypothetical protein
MRMIAKTAFTTCRREREENFADYPGQEAAAKKSF